MRQLYFCAQDIRDYLAVFTDVREFYAVPDFDPKFPPLNDDPSIQNVLRGCMNAYEYADFFLNAPIRNETDIDGLRLDFNFGLRLEVPEGNFHVRISDAESGQIFFDRDISDVRLVSVEKFLIRWRVEIFRDGSKVFEHELDLKDRPVFVAFQKKAILGDTLAMLPSISEFERRTGCKLTVFLPEYLREIAANLYPKLKQVDEFARTEEFYATFFPSWGVGSLPILPVDLRSVPLANVPELHFGMKLYPSKPMFKPTAPPVTDEPYVCIGVQASHPRKGWLYTNGWNVVVDYLKNLGYRVFCIDKNASEMIDGMTIQKPAGAEDFTGDFSIMHRANMLYHADFFIGLSSGLSWIANAVNCPVVMICGFSHNWFEFDTPYRVANRKVCNGCLTDTRFEFIGNICPRYAGTSRELECQKKISPRQVINAIEQLITDRNLTPPILRTR